MATLQEVKDKADVSLIPLWQQIKERQAIYYKKHGRYWQGLITHSAAPVDGIEAIPDCLLVTPTDQKEPWIEFLGKPLPPIPFSITLNVYDGPQGKGYQAIARVEYKGILYERAAQFGPEEHKAFDWRKVAGIEDE